MEKHFEILRPGKGISKALTACQLRVYAGVVGRVLYRAFCLLPLSARKEWPNQGESSSSLTAPSLSASVLRLRVECD